MATAPARGRVAGRRQATPQPSLPARADCSPVRPSSRSWNPGSAALLPPKVGARGLEQTLYPRLKGGAGRQGPLDLQVSHTGAGVA